MKTSKKAEKLYEEIIIKTLDKLFDRVDLEKDKQMIITKDNRKYLIKNVS